MAELYANAQFNYDHLDLSRVYYGQVSSEFLDNEYQPFDGRVYEDVLDIVYYDAGYAGVTFGGTGMTVTASAVTGGTITGILETVLYGSSWVPTWWVQDFSHPAAAVFESALTTNPADEFALVAQVLSGNDYFRLSPYADLIRAQSGDDVVDAGGGNDTVYGDAGRDIIRGGPGSDRIDGGTGLDHAVFDALRSQSTITRLGNGDLQVSGPEGTDQLTGVERLAFADRSLGFDADGMGGTTYRLYRAAYDRAPDAEGLGFWLHYLDRGFDLVLAADNFLNQQEFRSMYDRDPVAVGYQAPMNEEYVRLVYQHVLQREPELAGYQFWVDAMANRDGIFGHAWTKGEVLILFAESGENKANTVELIGRGFEYVPLE